MHTKLIGIIGLNLWGASAGLALRRAAPHLTIAGHDRDRHAMKQAKQSGAVAQTYLSVANLASDADILILAEPMEMLAETVEIIGRYLPPHALVVDFAPFKKPVQGWITAHMRQGFYVPCQPIPTQAGQVVPTADFWADGVWCVMPAAETHRGAVETAVQVGHLLGCAPLFLDVAEYESYQHALHTMPALLATALQATLTSAPSWPDMARLGGGALSAVQSLIPPPETLAQWVAAEPTAVQYWVEQVIVHLRQLQQEVGGGMVVRPEQNDQSVDTV